MGDAEGLPEGDTLREWAVEPVGDAEKGPVAVGDPGVPLPLAVASAVALGVGEGTPGVGETPAVAVDGAEALPLSDTLREGMPPPLAEAVGAAALRVGVGSEAVTVAPLRLAVPQPVPVPPRLCEPLPLGVEEPLPLPPRREAVALPLREGAPLVLAEGQKLTDALVDPDAEGDAHGEGDTLGEPHAESMALGEPLGEREGERLSRGVVETVGEGAPGERVACGAVGDPVRLQSAAV